MMQKVRGQTAEQEDDQEDFVKVFVASVGLKTLKLFQYDKNNSH